MGAVRKPLTFQAVGTVTLLDALARSEGLTSEAGMEVLVTHGDQVERVEVKRLLKDADPSVNIALHGGEEIRVPDAGKIFVVGNVRKPGAFPVHDAGGSSVLKMVALSEGLAPYAGKMAYIFRRDESGVKQEVPVELERILQRKAPDVPLEVDDVLYIPDNKGRRAAMNVIDRVTTFGASTGAGLLIWH